LTVSLKLLRSYGASASVCNGSVATIGNFDGVHIGHQAILRQLKKASLNFGLPCCVVLFEPQPKEYFQGADAPTRIYPLRDKLTFLANHGVNIVLCLSFNEQLRELLTQNFIQEILVDCLNIKYLVAGEDFRFAKERKGDFSCLEKFGKTHAFITEKAETVFFNGSRVSSTKIREELKRANLGSVQSMLGRSYQISGKVIHGNKLGRTIGVPTANICYKHRKIPINGVFAAWCYGLGGKAPCVVNIGVSPSITNDKAYKVEAHLLNFDQDIYGERLSIDFIKKIRDEMVFASKEALKTRIEQDILEAKSLLRTKENFTI